MTAALILALSVYATPQNDMPKSPVAKIESQTLTLHGEKLVDDYAWLRRKDSKEVLDYLNAENAYAEAVMKPTEALQNQLYDEMLGRIKQTDLSVPYPKDGYLYYSRTEEGKQYPIMCRKKGEKGAEEVLLDVNQLAEGEKFMSVGSFEISDDGQLLAYTTDNTGFRQYSLHVKNLATGSLLPETAERVTSLKWAADNKTLFFGTEDPVSKRSNLIFRLALGGKPEQIFEEKDELYRCGVGKSLDKELLFIQSSCSDNDETWFLGANNPKGKFKLIEKRQGKLQYDVAHHNGQFFIRTNKNAKDFEIMSTSVSEPGQKHWKPFIPAIPKGMISGFSAFKDYLVYSKRENGLPGIAIYDFATKKTRVIETSEALFSISGSTNAEYDTKQYRYSYASPLTPQSIYEIDLKSFEKKLLKQTEVLGEYDASLYAMERTYATAPDGTRVPIGLIYRKDKKSASRNPLVLYGYGAYGISSSFGFNSNLFSLLDRGVVWATGQIRGGGDMGELWHDEGKMMAKRNTFTDFAACADHLVYEGWTSRDRLAIYGGSAGGLLVGATLNIRPDLCKAAYLSVPFVDVINTMYDESLPLTVGEFLEWGNPKKESEYRYIRTYSPYENIKSTADPEILVKTSYNDSQVMYWEPAKYVARMRAHGKPASVIFKTNMAGGHGGSSGRFDVLRERAFDYAWFLEKLGVK